MARNEADSQKNAFQQGYRVGAAQRFLPPQARRARMEQDLGKARKQYAALLNRRKDAEPEALHFDHPETVKRRMMIYQMGVIEGCKVAIQRGW